MFENIKDGIKAIRDDYKQNNVAVERRFKQTEEEIKVLRLEVEELKTFKTKALVVWAMGTTATSIIINKYL